MLRFFRRYNKHILISGAALLMVAFLIGPALEQWRPDPGTERIGTLAGRELTREDEMTAARQLEYLTILDQQLGRGMGQQAMGGQLLLSNIIQMTGRHDLPRARLTWLMMTEEAGQLGFEPSPGQIQSFLQATGLDDDTLVALGGERMRLTARQARSIIGQALAVRDYLVAVTARDPHQIAVNPFGQDMLDLHDPLVQRLLHDTLSTVEVRAVPVNADRYYEQVEDRVTDERVKELYEAHRGYLPGPDRPYGLGYRHPDRVRLEYLEIPYEQVRQHITIGMQEALAFFEDEPLERFVPEDEQDDVFEGIDPEHPDVVELRYRRIRDRVHEELRQELALARVSSMADWIRDRIREPEVRKRLDRPGEDGRMPEIPEGFEPVSLEQAADEAEEAFDVRPRIRRMDRDWLDREALDELERISDAYVALTADLGATFADYVMHVHELRHPDADMAVEDLMEMTGADRDVDPIEQGLIGLRFRERLISRVLRDQDENRYLFRVIEVQPSHTPELEEIESRVRRDALRIEAFKKLQEEAETWRSRGTGSLHKLASELDRSIVEPRPFPRRQLEHDRRWYFHRPEGAGDDAPLQRQFEIERSYLAPPRISEAIERDATFVDHVFRKAERIQRDGGLGMVSRSDRTLAVPHEREKRLYIVRIEQFRVPDDLWEAFVQMVQWQMFQQFQQMDGFNPQMFETIQHMAPQRAMQQLMEIYAAASDTGLDRYFTDDALAARVDFVPAERDRDVEPRG